MSTRCNVIMKQSGMKPLYFYRHSDGYPEVTGESLKKFVKLYTDKKMRLDLGQSAGWLIVQGHKEYLKAMTFTKGQFTSEDLSFIGEPTEDRVSGWKVGAYEPTDSLHGDIEYVYIIDLNKRTLEMRKGGDEHSPLVETITF